MQPKIYFQRRRRKKTNWRIMDSKVIKFDDFANKYRKLIEKRLIEEDYKGALGFLFSALKNEPENFRLYAEIAEVYTEMELFELSIKYWFLFLDKAPKEEYPRAYEDLAINYFYVNNLWASSYYFNLKLKEDGFVSKERFGEEMTEFFFHTLDKKSLYHVAYPFDQADFSIREKLGKKALSAGDYKMAKSIYASIPTECRSLEADGEYAIASHLTNDDEETIKIAKESLKKHGDNVTAFCSLSTVYKAKDNLEKSKYYYEKALQSRKGDNHEAYQIATCAIDLGDHITANECLKTILEDRPFDNVMGLFYAISFINIGKYEKALLELESVYKLDPTDEVLKFYLDYVKNLLSKGDDGKLLPLEYVKGFPKKVENKYSKEIEELLEQSDFFSKKTKRKSVYELLNWGIKHGDDKTAKKCVYAITLAGASKQIKKLKDSLLDPEISIETKGGILYALIINLTTRRFGVVVGEVYENVKLRKLAFENTPSETRFLPAYALAMSRIILSGVSDYDKIGVSASRLYKKHAEEIEKNDLDIDELASMIVIKCNYKIFKSFNDVYKVFGVAKNRIEIIENILRGSPDENN